MPTLGELGAWLTVSEAAEALGVTRRTLYAWLDDGRLRAARTKHGWIIDPESVVAYRVKREERLAARGR